MRRHTVAALAASALAVGSVITTAPVANADLVTYCIGTGGAVTVPGDLYVPPGESCQLDGTTVTGNVRVAAGANLVVKGGTFQRDVQIASDGYYDATSTAVTGQITLASGAAVQGTSTFTGNQTGVQLGPNGSLSGCATGGYLGRDVTIANTTGQVRLDDNIINGKLILTA